MNSRRNPRCTTAVSIRDKGELPHGRKVTGKANYFLGRAEAPTDPKPDWQPVGLKTKIEAGAQFAQTQFCMDIGVVRRYMQRLHEAGIPDDFYFIIGIAPMKTAKSGRWMKKNLFGTIIPDPCRECSGDGRVRSRRTLTVKIPPGVDTGTRVQLSGQGEVGPGGGPAGDLYVEMHVTDHPVFVRSGADLHCTVTLPMTAAALGTTIELPLLEADLVEEGTASDLETSVPLDIKPGTQSGAEMVLNGRGVPALRRGRAW